MIDIHAHILPGIDDGAKDINESIEILKNASFNGVTDIVLTPHYILESKYNSTKNSNKKILDELKRRIAKEKINVNLFLGNEVYINEKILELLKNNTISTLNDSKYLLFELPMSSEYKDLLTVIHNLKLNEITPIIAHPERYYFIKKDPTKIVELHQEGALFQSNIGSLFGYYGIDAKKTLEKLLKHRCITFLSSDIHSNNHLIYDDIEKAKKILKKLNLSLKEIEELLIDNPKKVIENKEIESKEIIKFKKLLNHII